MNYSKIYNHKKRVVIPFLHVEVRGYFNLFIALLPTILFTFVGYILVGYLIFGATIPLYVILLIVLSYSDENDNGYIKKGLIKMIYKDDVDVVQKFNANNKKYLGSFKKKCSLISFNNYKEVKKNV